MRRLLLLLIVCTLLTASGVTQASPPRPTQAAQVVSITFRAYNPDTISIQLGEQVAWVNDDWEDHTVTWFENSEFPARLHPGESFVQEFDAPGIFIYYCEFYPEMQGAVEVKAPPEPEYPLYLPLIRKP